MLTRIRFTFQRFPRQFWYLIFGTLVSATGMGMIWPFLTIYIQRELGVSLTTVTMLLTLDSVLSIISSFIAGPITDRYGRKWVIALSLGIMGIVYAVMSLVTALPVFALLMALRGAVVPLYRIGADAMVADLIADDQRVEAYSLSRMVHNVGVALGPTAGGFVTGQSYMLAFFIAAGSLLLFGLFVAFAMRETLPARAAQPADSKSSGVYSHLLRDRFFQMFVLAFTFTGMATSLVFVLLGNYMVQNYGLPERSVGFVMAINAVMVVFLQVAVSLRTHGRAPLQVMALGGLLYALGIGSMALGSSFPHFAISMAVMTLGELVLLPTATTFAANLAPPEMRGRYMAIFGLGWSISHGFGPVVGGLVNDYIAPQAIWVSGLVWGLLSMGMYLALHRKWAERNETAPVETIEVTGS